MIAAREAAKAAKAAKTAARLLRRKRARVDEDPACIPRAAHMAQLALLRHAPTNDLLSTTCHTHVPCIHFAHRCAGCMRPYHLALDMRHRRTLDSSHPTDARPSLPLLLPVTCVNNNTTT